MEMIEINLPEEGTNNDQSNASQNISNSSNTTDSNAEAEDILKPGSKIKPNLTIDMVENLIQRLYGITASEIKELVSYDDRNYLIHEDRNIKNPLITNSWPHGYVLKILNAHDSQKLDFIDAQTQLMIYLKQKKFISPNPVRNVYGNYYSVELINNNKNVVRLLEYLPGKIFHDIPLTNHLFYQAGELVATLDQTLKHFNHEGYNHHKTVWMLQSVPKLREFIYILQDHSRKSIVEEVIDAFEKNVLSKIDSFEKGIIHGDYNEHNIVVTKDEEHNEYRISGVIDFGDTNYAPLIFELAIAMTYMMIESQDLATGGIVIAGYNSVRMLSNKEKEILKYCIAGRLCQSLVLGAYTHSLDPDNDYLLTTQKFGWQLLESIWKENYDKVDEIWSTTADKYLTQSVK